MKNFFRLLFYVIIIGGIYNTASCQPANSLKIILIRHGEKSADGDNLNCQGLNRSMQLPKVLIGKFGVPARIYVPTLNPGKSTSHARMFQTISPLAIKYNLDINAKYEVDDYSTLAKDIETRTGTIFVVWEHKTMDNIIRALGVKNKDLRWPDDDFDSIWIITYKNGKAVLTMDKEGLKPSGSCSF